MNIVKFGKSFEQFDVEQINGTIQHLEQYGSAKGEDVNNLKDYIDSLKRLSRQREIALEFAKTDDESISRINDFYDEVDTELERVEDVKIYNTSFVTPRILHGLFSRPFRMENTGYSNNSFYDFLKFIKQLNSFYDIAEPNIAPNRVAFGWDKAYERTHSRKYLYACVRNYLNDNGVEFETRDLQTIIFG